MIYRIPGLTPGTTQVNWVFYAPTPAWLRLDGPTSIPAGTLTDGRLDDLRQLAERHLPPYWAALVTLTPRERTFLQPVYDLETPRRTAGRLLLGGDAATVVRPHNTSGAVKALQDAHAFEQAGRAAATDGGSWPPCWPRTTRSGAWSGGSWWNWADGSAGSRSPPHRTGRPWTDRGWTPGGAVSSPAAGVSAATPSGVPSERGPQRPVAAETPSDHLPRSTCRDQTLTP